MLFLNLFFWLLVAGIWKYRSFSGGPGTKELLLQCGRSRFDPWFGKIPLEKGMATHSNILACEIPLTGDPGGLQSIHWTAAAAAKSLQSCPTLCDAIDSGPPGSPVPGILQARTLEWVAISFSNAWKWKVKWSLSVMSNSLRLHGLQPKDALYNNLIRLVLIYQLFRKEKKYYADCKTQFHSKII